MRRSARARRSRATAAIVAFTLALALAGGAYYLLAVRLPRQQRDTAWDEIGRWEDRLAAARSCLLGGAPLASTTREALAIRELSPDPWSRDTCTQRISRLSRGETEDTGVPAIEEAWRGLERAAGGVGAAFLAHLDPLGEPAAGRKPDRLSRTLDDLDVAHAALRAAAGLPPLPPRASAPPLPAAELIPLRDGDRPVRELASWTMPTLGHVIAFGGSEARELQLTLAPGAAPRVRPVGDGILRTVPDAAWGAGGGADQILIGPLDEAGALSPAPASPAAAPAGAGGAAKPDPRAVPVDGRGRVFAVAGTPEDGVVIAGGDSSLVRIRAEGGKLTADKPLAIEQLAFAVDPAGRTFVAYNEEPDGHLRGFLARGARAGDPIELGDTIAGGACLSARHAWIASPDSERIISYDTERGSVTPHTWPGHDLLGCTADAALLQKRNASSFAVCTTDCRVAVLQGMRPSKISTLAGDEVVSISLRDQVLGVWREHGPPRYFAASAPLLRLLLAISDGKVIDIVAQSDAGVVIARVPAR